MSLLFPLILSTVLAAEARPAPSERPEPARGPRLSVALSAGPDPAPGPWTAGTVRELLGRGGMRDLSHLQLRHRFVADRLPGTLEPDRSWQREQLAEGLEDRFLELVREDLEDRIGIEAAWERQRARFGGSRSAGSENRDREEAESWRVRISPRLRGGSDPSWGMKLSFPEAPRKWLRHAKLEARTWTGRDAARLGLYLDDGESYAVGIEQSFGDETEGPSSVLNVRLWW